MTYRTRVGRAARSAYDRVALIIRILFFATAGLLVALGASEVPAVRGWLRGLGPHRPLVGVVAGHWQNDAGAVCDDGLQEADLNLAVARQVALLLQEQGYDVDVLPEYSARLEGYQADAFLSIHVDSCITELSGFKIVGSSGSTDPEATARLVEHVSSAYALATGLAFHADTITDDMREYHAFQRVAPGTPAAIIECGFMGGDRYLLTEEQDRVAVGIANGLAAFLRESTQSTPSPGAG